MDLDTEQRSLAEDLGTWLTTAGEWTHFGSYTFRPYASRPEPRLGPARLRLTDVGPSEAAIRRFWDKYVRRVSRAVGVEIGWFVAFEPGSLLGRRHMHALLCNAEGASPEMAQRLWLYGRAKVEHFDVRRGAAYYVAKFAGQEFADWDLGGSLLRRKC